MTRIISGGFRGRRLKVPDDGTRPTSDRVREAVFNILDARIEVDGTQVLDLYAGSGALGLEALSRGASSATLVDSRRAATSVITANVKTCGVGDRTTVVTRTTAAFLATAPAAPLDLIFLDPPYDLDVAEVTAALAELAAPAWLAPDGLIVLERAVRAPDTGWPTELEVLVSKNYGDTRVEVAGRG
ncbi:16S rRNA (guanine(966)-N(2))-methyltransferase RsmD [Gordonia sp. CPCC 205515]|uniref:16S rRNA (guanine(966)-N(2))-methyltransferase RsmD n=1 Tax=Gordonia sp. CPCC 205515 TaxID=3140791 RepID=UPI003AF39E79